MKIFISLILTFILNANVCFGQSVSDSKSDYAKNLIAEVLRKAKDENERLYRDYQYSFKLIFIDEKTSKRRSESYEFYCRPDGRSYCQVILTGKNDKMISPEKLQKAREKASEKLAADTPQINRKVDYGYGTTFGYTKKGQNFWVDQAIYLKRCKLTDSAQMMIERRKTLQVDIADCDIETDEMKGWIKYMPQTRARLWLDEQDKAVTKMEVYPEERIAGKLNSPIITIEFCRTDEGMWLHKSGRLSTKNKSIFPLGVDDFEIEYFDYRKLNVEVEAKEVKTN